MKPYNNKTLNLLDGVILQIIIFTALLPLFDDFDSPSVITIAFLLVLSPLIIFIAAALFLHKDIKKFAAHCTHKDDSPSSDVVITNETPRKKFHLIVDDSTRKNVTICEL